MKNVHKMLNFVLTVLFRNEKISYFRKNNLNKKKVEPSSTFLFRRTPGFSLC
jgi:hypothetical protein